MPHPLVPVEEDPASSTISTELPNMVHQVHVRFSNCHCAQKYYHSIRYHIYHLLCLSLPLSVPLAPTQPETRRPIDSLEDFAAATGRTLRPRPRSFLQPSNKFTPSRILAQPPLPPTAIFDSLDVSAHDTRALCAHSVDRSLHNLSALAHTFTFLSVFHFEFKIAKTLEIF